MPIVVLAVILNDVEADIPNAMKLCSYSTPKCMPKVQKKRIKTVLKIASNLKWVTSEAKVKHLLNSVNMPKIKCTNCTGKEFNMIENELIMIDTLDQLRLIADHLLSHAKYAWRAHPV